MSYEPLTPIAIEERLRRLVNEMTKAQKDLADKRDLEVGAEIAHMRARDDSSMTAPPAVRGSLTVAERDEMISRNVRDEWEALRAAEAARKNAEDYLRTLRDQVSVLQTLSRSVETAYSVAGRVS